MSPISSRELEQRLRADARRLPEARPRPGFTDRVLRACDEPAPPRPPSLARWIPLAASGLAAVGVAIWWNPDPAPVPSAAPSAPIASAAPTATPVVLTAPPLPDLESLAALSSLPYQRELDAVTEDLRATGQFFAQVVQGLESLPSPY